MDIDKLKADIEAGTPGPWCYRPRKYDDWGLIRGGDDYPVASASVCRASELEMAEHRANKTDPSFHNASRIARVPELEDEVIRLTKRLKLADEIVEIVDRAQYDNFGPRVEDAIAAWSKGKP